MGRPHIPSHWEEISDVLTPEGIKRLSKGQILVFDYEGSKNQLKIMKVLKKAGRVWAKQVQTFKPDEVEGINDERITEAITNASKDSKG